MEQLQCQMELFVQANETLNALAARLNGYSSELLTRHKEEIAQLSVEIARRVLAQRIEEGDYDIEQVIKEAIDSVPGGSDISIRLNPEDLTLLESARQESGQKQQPENVKLVADASVGRAECLVDTPKGLVESRINEKLDQISSALKKAQ
jgi:flagellar biosynthesis/type III secretory pathway protein FliH